MGDPPLVMLDEPSTGMDPQSKRNLWDMMTESINGQRSAILTTHSMEEADALCDRIGIIFQGELRCIGSSQHLKDKFGYGYLLETKLSLPADVLETDRQLMVQTVKEEVRKILPGAAVVEEFYNRLMFAVSKDTITSLGRIFTDLDRSKCRSGMVNCSEEHRKLKLPYVRPNQANSFLSDRVNKPQNRKVLSMKMTRRKN